MLLRIFAGLRGGVRIAQLPVDFRSSPANAGTQPGFPRAREMSGAARSA
jgi:hypothetical protein